MGWPLPGKNQKLAIRTCSSVVSSGAIIRRRSGRPDRRSVVQIPPGPPATLEGEMIYPSDVRVEVRVP